MLEERTFASYAAHAYLLVLLPHRELALFGDRGGAGPPWGRQGRGRGARAGVGEGGGDT